MNPIHVTTRTWMFLTLIMIRRSYMASYKKHKINTIKKMRDWITELNKGCDQSESLL